MSEKSEIVSRLIRSKKSRDAYTRALINMIVPAQIRALRFKNRMTQQTLARQADMKQSRISMMERPGATQFNVETLIRLASALKLGLKVEFVSFGEMLRWENGFNMDAFNPLTIDKDTDFQREEAPAVACGVQIVMRNSALGEMPAGQHQLAGFSKIVKGADAPSALRFPGIIEEGRCMEPSASSA